MQITVLHQGVGIDLELRRGDTPSDLIRHIFASKGDGKVPEGVELRREGVALELSSPLPEEIPEGTILTLHLTF